MPDTRDFRQVTLVRDTESGLVKTYINSIKKIPSRYQIIRTWPPIYKDTYDKKRFTRLVFVALNMAHEMNVSRYQIMLELGDVV